MINNKTLITLICMFAIAPIAHAGANKALSLKEIDAKVRVSNNKPITWVLVSTTESEITIDKLSKMDRPDICMRNSVGKVYLQFHLKSYNKKISQAPIGEWQQASFNMETGVCLATVMPKKYFKKYVDSNKYSYIEISKPRYKKPALPF